MAKEQYLDIVRQVLMDTDYNLGNLYTSGEDETEEVLIIQTTADAKKLNQLLKDAFQKAGIDTFPDRDDDEFYIDFAMGDWDNWGFSDSYLICDRCMKAFLKDSNGMNIDKFWLNYDVGEAVCETCIRADGSEEDYLDYMSNNPERANIIFSDSELEKFGYVKVNDEHFAHGWYGQMDNPQQIYKQLEEKYPNASILFSLINNHNPFEAQFDVWIKGEIEND